MRHWRVLAFALSCGCSAILQFQDGALVDAVETCDGEDGTRSTCGNQRACIKNRCSYTCGTDSDCPGGLRCRFILTNGGMASTGGAASVRYCSSEGEQTCAEGRICPNNQVCVVSENLCRPACSPFEPFCPVGEQCVDRACQPTVPSPGDVVTTFTGRPRSITTVGDHVYYARNERVWDCPKTGCAAGGTSIAPPGVSPSGVVRLGTNLAWADTSQVRSCKVVGTAFCNGTVNVTAPGVAALAAYDLTQKAFWLSTSTDAGADYELIGWDGAGVNRLAVVPGPVGVPSAIAAVTEDRFFVMVDGRLRSVLNGASAPITDDEHRNAGFPGVAVTSGKVVWLLEQGALRSVYQCVIEEFAGNPPTLCNLSLIHILHGRMSSRSVSCSMSLSPGSIRFEARPISRHSSPSPRPSQRRRSSMIIRSRCAASSRSPSQRIRRSAVPRCRSSPSRSRGSLPSRVRAPMMQQRSSVRCWPNDARASVASFVKRCGLRMLSSRSVA